MDKPGNLESALAKYAPDDSFGALTIDEIVAEKQKSDVVFQKIGKEGKYKFNIDPVEAYLSDPEKYNQQLRSGLSGYGGNYGDYEAKEMRNHWERFEGPGRFEGPDEATRNAIVKEWDDYYRLSDAMKGIYNTPEKLEARIKERTSSELMDLYTTNTDSQFEAQRLKFINDPENEYLGDSKEDLAIAVSHAMTDPTYDAYAIEADSKRDRPYLNTVEERMARMIAEGLNPEGKIYSWNDGKPSYDFGVKEGVNEALKTGLGTYLNQLEDIHPGDKKLDLPSAPDEKKNWWQNIWGR